MAVKKRCPYCLKKLRPDGTCGYEKCPRYVPDPEPEPTPTESSEGNTSPVAETPSTGEPAQSDGNTETEPTS